MKRSRQSVSRPEICDRTRRARIEAGFPRQEDIAKRLDIDTGKYNKYETRSPLPHEMIIPFCKLTNVSVEWLLQGTGQKEFVDYDRAIASIHKQLETLQERLPGKS